MTQQTIEVRVPGGEHAERLLIGAAMYHDSPGLAQIIYLCEPTDFLGRDLGTLWGIIQTLTKAEKHVDLVTLIYTLTQTGFIKKVDEVELTALFNDAFVYTGLATMEAHAGIVAAQGKRKREWAQLQEDVQDRVKNLGSGEDWWEKYGNTD